MPTPSPWSVCEALCLCLRGSLSLSLRLPLSISLASAAASPPLLLSPRTALLLVRFPPYRCASSLSSSSASASSSSSHRDHEPGHERAHDRRQQSPWRKHHTLCWCMHTHNTHIKTCRSAELVTDLGPAARARAGTRASSSAAARRRAAATTDTCSSAPSSAGS